MKIWKFEVKEGDDYVDYYRTSEDEAKLFKKELDKEGEVYTLVSYHNLHSLIKNMDKWNMSNVSDGEMLDEVLNVIERIGL